MANKLKLTRDQLASFLKDAEQIKQFEQLFALADSIAPDVVNEININAGIAQASANEALAQLQRLADAFELVETPPPIEHNNSVQTDYVDINPLAPTPVEKVGRIHWSKDDATLEFGLEGGVTGQICQQLDFHPKNTGLTQINKGMAVMATGVVGSSTKITCARAVANGSIPSEYMLGIAAQNIPVNSFGYVVWFGSIRGFNTTGANKTVPEVWADGDILYFDPVYPGELTKVEPSAPGLDLPIAIVTNAANNGAIFVRMKTGESMNELHDVNTTTATNNDLLQYFGAGPYWRNVAPSTVTVGTATNLAGGLAGSVPYQTAASTTTFLSLGTAAQVLQVNAGATAPEWVSSTGTGNVVRATSPTLVTPLLGTPTSGTLTNCTGLPVATGISGLGANVATFLATPSSANLAAAVTDETGTGALVFGTSPTITTPTFTTSATFPLHIGGTGTTSTLTLRSTSGVGTTGADIIFQTGNNGATEAMRILNSGNVGIGTASPTSKLTVDGTFNATGNVTLGDATTDTVTVNGYMGVGIAANAGITLRLNSASTLTGTTQRGLLIDGTGSSGGTTQYAAIEVTPKTQAAAYTVTNLYRMLATNATKGAGSTITNQYGLFVADQTQGGTNNIGLRSLVSSGTGKWNIYADGTAANYFAGNVQFAAGAAATPSITRFSDDNTGFWFPAADTIAASTAGSERMRIDSSGNVLVTGTGGLGYGTGSGGAVTQITSRTTGVTLDKTNGAITLVSAAGTATWQSFTATNNKVAATDTVIVNQKSGTDLYMIHVTNVAAGSFQITFATTGGTTTEQPVFNFAIIKAVTS